MEFIVKGGRNQSGCLQDSLNDISLRREDQIFVVDPARNKFNDKNNTRSYTSCENGLAKRNNLKSSQKVSKFMNNKINPVMNSNRLSGNFVRDSNFYGTTRTYNRGQTHSMYWLSNVGTYIPLSANVRQQNQSVESNNPRISQERVYLSSPREIRKMRGINEDINVKILYQNWNKTECHFFDWILPLIKGATMYKKFSSNQLLKQRVFDPFNSYEYSPDKCGYGIRHFRLDPTLSYIEVRQHMKANIDQIISVEDIVKPIIPHTTIDIIRFQNYRIKNLNINNQIIDYSVFGADNNISNLGKTGDRQEFRADQTNLKTMLSNNHLQQYLQRLIKSDPNWVESIYYPFSMVLDNERIELITVDYDILNQWVIGLSLLAKFKKLLPKLRNLIEWKPIE